MNVIPGLLLVLTFSPLSAFEPGMMSQKKATPSALVKQLESEQDKLREVFERDLGAQRALPEDWEDRLQPLIKRSAGLSSEFRLNDWQGEELFALSALYFFGEKWSLALEGYQKFVAERTTNARDEGRRISNDRAEARFRIVRSLIELERIEEAATAATEVDRIDTTSPTLLAVRVLLHRDLALAYRDMGDQLKAVRQAIAGFEIGRRISQRAEITDQAREARDFETPRLVALSVALLERLDQKRSADELQRRWRATGRGRPAEADATYNDELAIQRLIGGPSPEVEAKVWIDPPPLTLTALRGKVVLLYFWASWNSSSTAQFARVKQWQTEYKDRGFQVVGVTRLFGRSDRATELKSLESLRNREGGGFPFAIAGQDDPTNDERFNVTTLPMLVLIDREGTVRRIDRGAPVRRYRGLRQAIEKLTASP